MILQKPKQKQKNPEQLLINGQNSINKKCTKYQNLYLYISYLQAKYEHNYEIFRDQFLRTEKLTGNLTDNAMPLYVTRCLRTYKNMFNY
jgi:uncharacterized membrane protein